MRPIHELTDYELGRFQRRLRHEVDTLFIDRSKPSKQRQVRHAHERDVLHAQLSEIDSEWDRRDMARKGMAG